MTVFYPTFLSGTLRLNWTDSAEYKRLPIWNLTFKLRRLGDTTRGLHLQFEIIIISFVFWLAVVSRLQHPALVDRSTAGLLAAFPGMRGSKQDQETYLAPCSGMETYRNIMVKGLHYRGFNVRICLSVRITNGVVVVSDLYGNMEWRTRHEFLRNVCPVIQWMKTRR